MNAVAFDARVWGKPATRGTLRLLDGCRDEIGDVLKVDTRRMGDVPAVKADPQVTLLDYCRGHGLGCDNFENVGRSAALRAYCRAKGIKLEKTLPGVRQTYSKSLLDGFFAVYKG